MMGVALKAWSLRAKPVDVMDQRLELVGKGVRGVYKISPVYLLALMEPKLIELWPPWMREMVKRGAGN